MKAKITIPGIAGKVGLSKSVVAKVLRNNRSNIRVGGKNADRIRKAAVELNYRPNAFEPTT